MPLKKDRQAGRLQELARVVKPRPAKGDIIALPLAGRPGGVEQRWILPVNGPDLAVGVGVGLVRIDDLDLELAHQKDAAVASILALADRRSGHCPLDVQLNIAELRLCLDGPSTRNDFQVPILHHPARGPALRGLPGIQFRSVKQYDRVLRGHGRRRTRSRGLDNRWPGAVYVMLPPARRGGQVTDPASRHAADQPGCQDY